MKLLIFGGGSGSGKSSTAKRLYESNPEKYHLAISVTTRDIRVEDNEIDGVDYHFRKEIDPDELLEYEEFNGNTYGTLKSEIKSDKTTLLVLEPNGIKSLEKYAQANNLDYFIIHFNIPEKERREKMISRGDSKESIYKRLSSDSIDRAFYGENRILSDLTIHTYLNDPIKEINAAISFHKEAEKRMDRFIDIRDSFDFNKNTVIVGDNSSGKSFFRKQLAATVQRKHPGMVITSVSMQTRTESLPDRGAFSSFMHDQSDVATSHWTSKLIRNMFNDISEKTQLIVIDEPEIGLSKETTLAIVNLINEQAKKVKCGILVITHSETVLKHFNYDRFINLSKEQTLEEYLNREIVPTNLDELERNRLYRLIENRIQRNKRGES